MTNIGYRRNDDIFQARFFFLDFSFSHFSMSSVGDTHLKPKF